MTARLTRAIVDSPQTKRFGAATEPVPGLTRLSAKAEAEVAAPLDRA